MISTDGMKHIVKELMAIKEESITLPADVMLGYSTGRPELFAVVQRDMTAEEVKNVLDALAGQMRLNQKYQELVEEQGNLLEEQQTKLRDIERVLQS